mmetsp:Transcript_10298/g.21642  ORF Transcript_10298/g.21642 Transcript_10298/m.21642 type:complete len:288 (+) Transcript_10298:162-1025(+)
MGERQEQPAQRCRSSTRDGGVNEVGEARCNHAIHDNRTGQRERREHASRLLFLYPHDLLTRCVLRNKKIAHTQLSSYPQILAVAVVRGGGGVVVKHSEIMATGDVQLAAVVVVVSGMKNQERLSFLRVAMRECDHGGQHAAFRANQIAHAQLVHPLHSPVPIGSNPHDAVRREAARIARLHLGRRRGRRNAESAVCKRFKHAVDPRHRGAHPRVNSRAAFLRAWKRAEACDANHEIILKQKRAPAVARTAVSRAVEHSRAHHHVADKLRAVLRAARSVASHGQRRFH